ncbi:MAG TPA: hypothetical protein DCM05_14560 [Elusimicrobia bacterium]|nr:hypothetical protein [Elusimicrobiota bacterium]
MKTKVKAMGLLLAMGIAALGVMQAQAADPDLDSLTITIQPATDLGVDVDTTTARLSDTDTPGTMSLTMQLGATAYLVSPASVTILGTFNNQEVQLKAACLDSWAIDADETAEADKVQVYALFSVDKASRPVELEFAQGGDARHLVTGTNKEAGETAGSENDDLAGNQFEIAAANTMAGGTNMDNLAVGTQKQLWIRVDTPPTSTSEDQQRVQVTLTAVSGKTY